MNRFLLFLLMLVFLVSCHSSEKSRDKTKLIFCAASLTDVVSDIISSYESETNTVVKLNLASSGTLARQIENGAQPDIFISANKKWLDYLIQLDKVDKEKERPF